MIILLEYETSVLVNYIIWTVFVYSKLSFCWSSEKLGYLDPSVFTREVCFLLKLV